MPQPGSAFSISIPSYLANSKEHINTQEMGALQQVLLYWGRHWQGRKIIIHVDNRAVAHAVSNRSIRGAPMKVLRRCLLLATEYHCEVEARWISTKDNALADALSQFDHDRICDIALQLMAPPYNLQGLGLLTYSNRASRQARPTTSGVGSHPQLDETTILPGRASRPFVLSPASGTKTGDASLLNLHG